MRMICMFDLPVDTDKEKRAYRKFRTDIIKEGFVMIQYSVYSRVCPDRQYAKALEKRLKKLVPTQGNVRLLMVTEKQYQDMVFLVGHKTITEEKVGSERLIIL